MLKNKYLNIKTRKRIIWILIFLLIGFSGLRLIYDLFNPRGFFGIGLPSSMKIYVSKTGHFSLSYPEDWTATDTPQGNGEDIDNVAIIKPFRPWPSLLVATKGFPEGNIDQVMKWGETRAEILHGYTQDGMVKFATPYIEGLSMTYEWQSKSLLFGETPIQCVDYYILIKETGYILKFCAEKSQWSTVEDVFQQMVDSFVVR